MMGLRGEICLLDQEVVDQADLGSELEEEYQIEQLRV